MTTDTIPHSAIRTMRQLAAPFRFRVTRDAEGWPVIPGKLGRIEWHCDGQDCHGCPEPGRRLAVWSDRSRLFAKLGAIPGVRRWQTGDWEMRALFPEEALEQVAGVTRARRRRLGRPLTAEHALRLRAGARVAATSRPEDDEDGVGEGEDSGADWDGDETGPDTPPRPTGPAPEWVADRGHERGVLAGLVKDREGGETSDGREDVD